MAQVSPPSHPASEPPTAAFVLTLLGGLFVILGGLALSVIGVFVARGPVHAHFRFGGVLAGMGIVGIVLGALIVLGSWTFYTRPVESQRLWGVLIVVLSVLSLVFALGGFLIGFFLSLIGGIFILTWHPRPPGGVLPPGIRVCLACGRQVDPSGSYCHVCGKALSGTTP